LYLAVNEVAFGRRDDDEATAAVGLNAHESPDVASASGDKPGFSYGYFLRYGTSVYAARGAPRAVAISNASRPMMVRSA
jgi:hypothetical protein